VYLPSPSKNSLLIPRISPTPLHANLIDAGPSAWKRPASEYPPVSEVALARTNGSSGTAANYNESGPFCKDASPS